MSNTLKPFKIRTASLQFFVEHLREQALPLVAAVSGHNGFHSEIQRVSENLLRDIHYKQAPIEANIQVIEWFTPD